MLLLLFCCPSNNRSLRIEEPLPVLCSFFWGKEKAPIFFSAADVAVEEAFSLRERRLTSLHCVIDQVLLVGSGLILLLNEIFSYRAGLGVKAVMSLDFLIRLLNYMLGNPFSFLMVLFIPGRPLSPLALLPTTPCLHSTSRSSFFIFFHEEFSSLIF